jgi:hypothetical protein
MLAPFLHEFCPLIPHTHNHEEKKHKFQRNNYLLIAVWVIIATYFYSSWKIVFIPWNWGFFSQDGSNLGPFTVITLNIICILASV